MQLNELVSSSRFWSGLAGRERGTRGTEQGSALLWAEKGVQLKSTKLPAPTGPHNLSSKPTRGRTPPVPESLQPQVITRQESVATSRSPSSPAGSAVGNPRPGSSEGREGARGSAVLNSPKKLGSPRWPTGGERSPSTPTRWAGGRRPGLTDTRAAFRNDRATTFVGASRPRLRLVAPGSGGAPTPRAKRRAWSAPRGRLCGPPRTRAAWGSPAPTCPNHAPAPGEPPG